MLRNFSWFKNANDSKEEDENLYQPIGNGNRLTTAYPKIYEPIILDLYNYVENAPVNFTDPDGKQRRHMFDVGLVAVAAVVDVSVVLSIVQGVVVLVN